ncbi:MAG: hypothetical protein EBT44_02825 [Actinobacteria bacterium]|uniref:Polysaccharide pyruvyl transferase domain-containing protein n=1 Tax=Candidatus Fonsibacter lacus TaxID=2576439 RepID=A0A965GC57_9PROT|nr:hypothetical protein [Candidatus Fonsibacter lacus]
MSQIENHKIVVCSFYTEDEYYSAHAKKLIENLERLGFPHEVSVMNKQQGEDWADICRKKVGFLASICVKHPDKKVFWIDVDCELLSIPDYVVYSTADIIGFQRSFGSPLNIGYQNRTRFWEPCFWGVNNTPQGRKMIEDAYLLEQTSTIKATDDYFFEEGWRANASNLTFQLIPSSAVADRVDELESSRPVFFKFGSSGKVAEFKNQVEQHKLSWATGARTKKARRKALSLAKRVHNSLPESVRLRARKLSDKSGITRALTSDLHNGLLSPEATSILHMARVGRADDYNKALENFRQTKIPTSAEKRMLSAASSFLDYSSFSSDSMIKLSWWCHPYPGNFGDWLSPYLFQKYARQKVQLQPLGKATNSPHIISVGSIGRFIKKSSIVVGTGVSSSEFPLEPKAKYFSLRGPRSADILRKSGGPVVERFGDPALLMSRIFPVIRGQSNGKVAFIRHHAHRSLPVELPENFEELSVLKSHPEQIEEFMISLNNYDFVVTSAMHIFIVCQSYGIPVSLVTFQGSENSVHGDGIKYVDYCEGAGVPVLQPYAIPLDFRKFIFDDIITLETISEGKMNEIEMTFTNAIEHYSKFTERVKIR